MQAEPIEPSHPQAKAEEDRAADDAQERPWPRPHELGATVFLDRILHHDAEEILRLDTAKVFGNGVILVVDYVNLRGKGEDGLAWFHRSDGPHGSVELDLALRDPATGAAHACTWHGGEGSVGPGCYTLHQHFWIDWALEAGVLRGSLTVNHAVAADGTSEPLVVDVHLDTTVLREAATRIRTVATQWPRA